MNFLRRYIASLTAIIHIVQITNMLIMGSHMHKNQPFFTAVLDKSMSCIIMADMGH